MSTTEENRILREAECNTAEDAYFEARPQIDCADRRRVFEAGFERAWTRQQDEIDRLRLALLTIATAAQTSPAARRIAADTLAGPKTGYCTEGDRCVCGGDTPGVRAGCANWVTPNVERNRPGGGFSPEGPVDGRVGRQTEE